MPDGDVPYEATVLSQVVAMSAKSAEAYTALHTTLQAMATEQNRLTADVGRLVVLYEAQQQVAKEAAAARAEWWRNLMNPQLIFQIVVLLLALTGKEWVIALIYGKQ